MCGVDEAGRGPAMGPLVVGAVAAEEDEAFRQMGVKDSKQLTPRARERLYEQIIDAADHWSTEIISAEEIDEQRKSMSLNEIEMRMFCRAADMEGVSIIYADCPDINEDSFGQRMKALFGKDVEIIAKHKADDTYPVVSAASIIAKVTRDRMMEDIRREFGTNVGSGYPSDHYTMDFIREWIEKNGSAPPHVRTSWEPVKEMLSVRKNTRIDDW